MNHLHLQETARHYANLAEQYRSQLMEEQQLNEEIIVIIQALCEELNIDVEQLFLDEGFKDFLKKTGRMLAVPAAALTIGSGVGAVGGIAQPAITGAKEAIHQMIGNPVAGVEMARAKDAQANALGVGSKSSVGQRAASGAALGAGAAGVGMGLGLLGGRKKPRRTK
jgi:hypothetical protein